MNFRKKGLLSIGQIAKLLDLDPKSILYYEKLGIFLPTCVDETNKYRYYSPSQLALLSAIKLCVQLGIPLREFAHYRNEISVYPARLLDYAAEITREKLRQLESSLDYIQQLRSYVALSTQVREASRVIYLEFPQMYFLKTELPADCNSLELLPRLKDLTQRSARQNCGGSLLFGKAALYHRGQLAGLYAVQKVPPEVREEDLLVLPQGRYACLALPATSITKVPQLFGPEAAEADTCLALESFLVPDPHRTDEVQYLLRCICL